MAQSTPQTFENHVRIVPAYHIVLFGIVILNLVWSAYKAVRYFSFDTVVSFLLACGLVILFFCTRIFVLRVQDRVIRLEMRLRMERVLPPELRSRISDFTVGQLIALRFASDEELPELARRVLADNLTERKAIKRMIKHWNPDTLRA
jgi:uncharacterized membrane protein YciS (DUF1049 family)